MPAQPTERPGPTWRKSRASDSSNCVEAAFEGSSVLVRDSHDKSGPILVLTPGQWRELMTRIRER
ncbi:MAG TPA: DUF397 domain-containing protein [Streptosporangiaceae bacterium]